MFNKYNVFIGFVAGLLAGSFCAFLYIVVFARDFANYAAISAYSEFLSAMVSVVLLCFTLIGTTFVYLDYRKRQIVQISERILAMSKVLNELDELMLQYIEFSKKELSDDSPFTEIFLINKNVMKALISLNAYKSFSEKYLDKTVYEKILKIESVLYKVVSDVTDAAKDWEMNDNYLIKQVIIGNIIRTAINEDNIIRLITEVNVIIFGDFMSR